MKFKPKRTTIEVEDVPGLPGVFYVKSLSDRFYALGQHIKIEDLIENFTPADCEALNLVDPDRTKRLCPPIIG